MCITIVSLLLHRKKSTLSDLSDIYEIISRCKKDTNKYFLCGRKGHYVILFIYFDIYFERNIVYDL